MPTKPGQLLSEDDEKQGCMKRFDDTIDGQPGTGTNPALARNNGLVVVAAAAAAATTTTTTSSIAGLSREELEQRLLSMEGLRRNDSHHREKLLEQRLLSVEGELQVLRRNNDNKSHKKQQPLQSMFSKLILAFLAGLFGFAPPLFVDVDAILRRKGWGGSWFGCPCWNRSGDDAAGGNPSSPIETAQKEEEEGLESGDNNDRTGPLKMILHRIRNNLRLPFFVFISLVDFADAILDIIVSVQGLLEDCSEDDDRVVKSWALVLFSGTILSRLLSGLFGVVYPKIDKTDREVSYFLVEMTIAGMEDAAALAYIRVKGQRGGKVDRLDATSIYLSALCGTLFAIQMLCQHKKIRKRLPQCTARFVLLWFSFVLILTVLLSLAMMLDAQYSRWYLQNVDTFWLVLYPIGNAISLFFLFTWIKYLYQKNGTTSRQSQTQFSDPSVPTGDNLAS